MAEMRDKGAGFGAGFATGIAVAAIAGLSVFSWALFTGHLARGEAVFSVEQAADYLPDVVKLPPTRKAQKGDFIGGQLGSIQ